MSSILTNNGAMVALQTLKSINSNLAKTQDQISTGKDVSSAKDNAGVWATAKTLEADVSGFKSIASGLTTAGEVVATARAGGEEVVTRLKDIRDKVLAAQNPDADKASLQNDINSLAAGINETVKSASVNGVNMIAATGDAYSVVSSVNRGSTGDDAVSHIEVAKVDLTIAADGDGVQTEFDIEGAADGEALEAVLAAVDTKLAAAISATASFGSAGSRIENQTTFLSKLTDSVTSAVGAMVDADMEEASARLQALQTQQQLGVQALSIANQAPQTILSLFRG